LDAFCAIALNCADRKAELAAGNLRVYGVYDTRTRNLGNAKIGNVDYSLRYNSRTPWGSVYFSVSGTIAVIRKGQATPTSPFIPNGPFSATNPSSKHSMTAQAGFTYGPLRASTTLQHKDGFRVPRSATQPYDRFGDFNLVNLFATWDFKG